MERTIESVAVIGAGTMGSGIAAVNAIAGKPVLLLDLNADFAHKALERLTSGRNPVIPDKEIAARITTGAIDDHLEALGSVDWICEVIIEDLAAKRNLISKLETVRKPGSIYSSNTSGIMIKDMTEDFSDALNQDIAVTHFFNPVHIMKLVELVPGEKTDPDVISALATHLGKTLKKGVVYAKDTPNFIGNRIGCLWLLIGLQLAEQALAEGVSMEKIDALLSKPIGLPPTGLFGLMDLVGIDVIGLVGVNLKETLPADDACQPYVDVPAEVQTMIQRGQIGRKAGAGFYKVNIKEDGSKEKLIYDLPTKAWRPVETVSLSEAESAYKTLMTANTPEGRFVWKLMSETLAYTASLIPEIADDIVNVDRAMRWGYNWAKGPFELIDELGAQAFAEQLKTEGRPIPKMVSILLDSGASSFYQNDGGEYLGLDGQFHPVPADS